METACIRCGRPGGGIGALGVSTNGNVPANEPFLPEPETPLDQPPSPSDGCRECRGKTQSFDSCIGLWTYDGMVCDAIVAAKFGSRIALADALGRRLAPGKRISLTL